MILELGLLWMSDRLRSLQNQAEILMEQQVELRVRLSQQYLDRITEISREIESGSDRIPTQDGKLFGERLRDQIEGEMEVLSNYLEDVKAQIQNLRSGIAQD